MTEQEIFQAFKETGALIKGHFVFSHGNHSDTFIDAERISTHPRIVREICNDLAKRFAKACVDVVIGPATGGIILGHVVAQQLYDITGRDITSIYVKRNDNGQFIFREGDSEPVKGKRVIIIDDIATTWGTIKQVVQLVKSVEGIQVGSGVIWHRNELFKNNNPDYDLIGTKESLLSCDVKSWSETDCQRLPDRPCAQGVAIDTLYGHGAQWIARKVKR